MQEVEEFLSSIKGLSRKGSIKQAAREGFISSESLELAQPHLHTAASKLKGLSKIHVVELVEVQGVADTAPKTAQRFDIHIQGVVGKQLQFLCMSSLSA